MAIIGFICMFYVLLIFTAWLVFMGFHGGYEFDHIELAHLWFYVPLCCLCGYGWCLLFNCKPFVIVGV